MIGSIYILRALAFARVVVIRLCMISDVAIFDSIALR
jgi:hypothetical protein